MHRRDGEPAMLGIGRVAPPAELTNRMPGSKVTATADATAREDPHFLAAERVSGDRILGSRTEIDLPRTATVDGPIILFDGVCKFCGGAVRFLLTRDRRKRLRFAPLQSAIGDELRQRFGLPADRLDTMVLIEGGRCHTKSSAALRIARDLSGLWPLLWVFLAVPKAFRDLCYDAFARRRYRWFGRSESCFVPTPDIRDRFLE